MSGGGGSKSTTVQKSDPWSGQQPYLTGLYQTATNLNPQQYYPGQTVADFNPWTRQGLDRQMALAQLGSPTLGAAAQQAQATLGGQGLSGAMGEGLNLQRATAQGGNLWNPFSTGQASNMEGVNYMRPFASGAEGQNNPFITGQGQSQAGLDTLRATSSGQMLGANPYAKQMFGQMAGDITNQVNSQFGAAGRTGSGLQTGVLGRALSDAGNNFYGQQYAQERQNQLSAANALQNFANQQYGQRQSAYEAAQGRRLEGAQAMQNALSQDQAQRQQAYMGERALQMGAANQMQAGLDAERQRQLTAAGLAPGLEQAKYLDPAQMAAAGTAVENKYQQLMNDAQQRWNFEQQAPYNQLGFQSQIIQGGFPGGTQTTTGPNANQSSTLANIIGGGSLGSAIGGWGAKNLGFMPFLGTLGSGGGGLVGAGLGLLGSFL